MVNNCTNISSIGEAKLQSKLTYFPLVDNQFTEITLGSESFTASMTSEQEEENYCFELAGPRKNIYFDPAKTKCAIVTCGGLCPGINDVIQAIVRTATKIYGVNSVLGIRYGLKGFLPEYGYNFEELTSDNCESIHLFGGTVLGTSRGPQSSEAIVDSLERMNISCLFVIGGDGTMKAAKSIYDEVQARKSRISVIGVPKTIDNDINMVPKSFGFETAVAKASESLQCAHTEAMSVINGIGMVKLMGRDSGFIAAQASVSLIGVDFCLIPEMELILEGENGLLAQIERKLVKSGHVLLSVAEGAGQNLLPQQSDETDASGNKNLGDICKFLKKRISENLKSKDIPYGFKYIDPSYIIRSGHANANDRVYCKILGQHAVHAAMSGRTGMVVSRIMDQYVHVPLELVTKHRRVLSMQSDLWRSVLETTGQDSFG